MICRMDKGKKVKKEKKPVLLSSTDANFIVEKLRKKGQRFPEESPGSADYVFYETLYKERPDSDMAFVWCIEHGVFSAKEAVDLHSKYLNAKKKLLKLNKEGLGKSQNQLVRMHFTPAELTIFLTCLYFFQLQESESAVMMTTTMIMMTLKLVIAKVRRRRKRGEVVNRKA